LPGYFGSTGEASLDYGGIHLFEKHFWYGKADDSQLFTPLLNKTKKLINFIKNFGLETLKLSTSTQTLIGFKK
jgi:hypothetical protein